MKKLFFSIIFIVCEVAIGMGAGNNYDWIDVIGRQCVEGPRVLNNGNVIWVWCLDASGTYIEVNQNLEAAARYLPNDPTNIRPSYDQLRNANPEWTWDVERFRLRENGILEVKTNDIYGTGNTYLINVH